MRVFDSEFNEKEDSINPRYNETYNHIIEYLQGIIDDEKIMLDIIQDNDNIIIQETSGEYYSIKLPNNSIKKNRFSRSIGALKTNMHIILNNEELRIIPGIALRPNFNTHQLVHELLHAVSSKQDNHFNDKGVVYTKTGTKVDYYDKNLDDYKQENNPSSEGLNEGITELLASIITNEYTGSYAHLVVISKLLMTKNNYLLNAYFSDNLSDLEKFYDDLEKKQTIITRNDLCELSSKGINEELVAKIIAGSIEYNKAYNDELEPNAYSNMINYLDNVCILDSGSWSDLIENFQNTEKITI